MEEEGNTGSDRLMFVLMFLILVLIYGSLCVMIPEIDKAERAQKKNTSEELRRIPIT